MNGELLYKRQNECTKCGSSTFDNDGTYPAPISVSCSPPAPTPSVSRTEKWHRFYVRVGHNRPRTFLHVSAKRLWGKKLLDRVDPSESNDDFRPELVCGCPNLVHLRRRGKVRDASVDVYYVVCRQAHPRSLTGVCVSSVSVGMKITVPQSRFPTR